MRVIDFFDRGADRFPDRPALVSAGDSLTYAEAREWSNRIAAALEARGLPADAKIAIYSPNDIRAFLCVLATLRRGNVWVTLNARSAIDENLYILQNTECSCLFYHSDFAHHLDRIRRDAPGLDVLICLDREDDGVPSLEQFVHGAMDAPPPAPIPDDPMRLATLFSTGGTTGRPKGVMWTNLTWETMCANFWVTLPCADPPVYLVAAPMTHAAGVTAIPLMAAGATVVILGRADPLEIMEAIQTHGVTHLFLPPTVIYMMLAHPRVRAFDYSSLRYFLYAAAPMASEKLREALDVFGPVMTQSFGQAEAPMFCTILTPTEHLVIGDPAREGRLLSCGRETMFTTVAIMDDDGGLLPTGERGEIVVGGNLVMAGYYRNPEATAEASRFGWHHTGDVGFKDADGFVYIVDRKKDMIISGGFNIYSTEIEQVLLAHPAVQDCAVFGVPDPKWGEAVTAAVELKSGQIVAAADLIAFCKARLGGMKAPKTVAFRDLPRSPVGKVLKRAIRDEYWVGHERAV